MFSSTLNKLAEALVKAQAEIGTANKGAANPFFKSKYADFVEIVNTIKEPLNKHGISFLQLVNNDGGQIVVDTMLLHTSGEYIISRTPVIIAKANDPQSLGSSITYAKRYGLQAIVGVPADLDDDGESAMGRASKPVAKPAARMDYKSNAPTGGDLF